MTLKSPSSYLLACETRSDYFYAHITEDRLTTESTSRYLDEIVRRSTDADRSWIVIERDVALKVPLDEATQIVCVFLSHHHKVAFVNTHEAAVEDLRRLVDMATGLGGNIAYFETVANAEIWLRA